MIANHVEEPTSPSTDNVTVSFTDEGRTSQSIEVFHRPADASVSSDEPDKSDEPTGDTSTKNRKKKMSKYVVQFVVEVTECMDQKSNALRYTV